MFIHNRFKVFFLSFKFFSFLAKAFLSVAEGATTPLQAFLASVSDDVAELAPSSDAVEELALSLFFGLA